jgi:SET domain-containing protein
MGKGDFEIRQTPNGKGVFALKDFLQGESLFAFTGKIFRPEEVPENYDNIDDHYVQIGKELYMGPSGEIDDLFNHSCDPNSGLKIDGEKVTLAAIRDIKKGEEIVWDYSTTMDEDDWELECSCQSPKCRGKIRDFKYLPEDLRAKYINMGIVPEYVSNSTGGGERYPV